MPVLLPLCSAQERATRQKLVFYSETLEICSVELLGKNFRPNDGYRGSVEDDDPGAGPVNNSQACVV